MNKKLTPHEYQEDRIDSFLLEPTRAALVSDEPGSGKTLTATEIIIRGGFKRVLIVGVKDTFDGWLSTLAAQSDGGIVLRRLDSTAAGKRNMNDFMDGADGIFFTGSQYLVRQDWEYTPTGEVDENGKAVTERKQRKIYKKMRPLDLLVWDEVHALQNRKSASFKTAQHINAEYRIGLSGTPGGNNFDGLWAVTKWLWPETIDGSYWRWREEWCETEEVYLPGGKSTKRVIGERNPGAFVASLPLYFRFEAEPVPAPVIVEVDLEPEQREQYDILEHDLMLWYEEHVKVIDMPAHLRQMLRTATLGTMSLIEDDEIHFDIDCRSAKLRALSGILKSWGTERVIIGMDSKRFLKATVAQMKRAGLSVAEWSGDVSTKERERLKAAFLDGSIQYLAVTISSFSTGLDGFQNVCSKMVMLSELDGDEITNEQFVRRLWRPPYNTSFTLVKLIARDTWDDDVHRGNAMKSASSRRALRIAA